MVHITMNGNKNSAREEALALIAEKEKIEATINELKGILDSNREGLTGPLIDAEGFPRDDIDVYQVRHARHRIICLQNDHKALMKKIEEKLNVALAPDFNDSEDEQSRLLRQKLQPFAVVSAVEATSPAEDAGLQKHDEIVQFGSVTSSNFNEMSDIGRIVQHSEGRTIEVKVVRVTRETPIRFHLRPRRWQGPGLLGCTLLPITNPER